MDEYNANSIQNNFFSFFCLYAEKRTNVVMCLFWMVWKERNSRAFNDKELSDQGMKLAFLCNLWAWSLRGVAFCCSLYLFVGTLCILHAYFGALFWRFSF